MCCLSYEENAYEYLNSIMPMVGSTVRTRMVWAPCWK